MLFVVSDPRFESHDTGRAHPERPARLHAVRAALDALDLEGEIHEALSSPAAVGDLFEVHDVAHVERLIAMEGEAHSIDADTVVNPGSIEAALLAAGAGLVAIDGLKDQKYRAAFCAVRPPGHHATRSQAMGFCLFNNVAVTAKALTSAGERVAIVDFDAHHGNGTQDIFLGDPQVLYVSWHESPNFPGTGGVEEVGTNDGAGFTINLPFVAQTTAASYFDSFDSVVGPALERFAPTWILISAGFDAHDRDPLCGLKLEACDFGRLTQMLVHTSPQAKVISFLEGGYDLNGLAQSTHAHLRGLLGETFDGSEGHHLVSSVAHANDQTIALARSVHAL